MGTLIYKENNFTFEASTILINMNIYKHLTFFLFFTLPFLGFGQNEVFGKWKTIDDDTGKEKRIVEIFEKDGKAYGRVVKLLNPSEPNPICDDCGDDRKDQPIEGMEIIRALVKDGSEWEDGTIVDPENGKVYDCKIWVEDNKLMVRGYIAFFFRTQEWIKM